MTLNIFSCASWPSVCHLWRNVCLGLLFTFWLGCLCFWYWAEWTVYILEINPLSVASFEYLSHSEGCLFILFMISFVQKILSFIRSHLFIFVFYFHYSRIQGKKDLAVIYVRECSVFSFKSFKCLALHLGLWSILSLFLCMVLRSVLISFFCFLHVAVQFSQHHLWDRLSFLIVYCHLLCQR